MIDKKTFIRRGVLTLLRDQKEEERRRRSAVIQGRLEARREYREAKTILFFASLAEEVDTFPLMDRALMEGKTVILPVTQVEQRRVVPVRVLNLERDLEWGPYRIRQPRMLPDRIVDPARLECVLVPAVAFDRDGYRLGRGGGFYDRFLRGCPFDTPTIGLAFSFQILDEIPREPHDVRVSLVISDA